MVVEHREQADRGVTSPAAGRALPVRSAMTPVRASAERAAALVRSAGATPPPEGSARAPPAQCPERGLDRRDGIVGLPAECRGTCGFAALAVRALTG